jgi:chromosome segregation ATPase
MNGTIERMVPTDSTTVQAAIKSIDRKAIRRQLDAAIAEKERRLAELDQKIAGAEQELFACEFNRLTRRLNELKRERLDAENNLSGAIHAMQKQLSKDASADKRLGARLEEVAAHITREMNGLQTVSSNSPKRYAEQTERVKTLVKARIELDNIMLASDPHTALTDFVKTFALEG